MKLVTIAVKMRTAVLRANLLSEKHVVLKPDIRRQGKCAQDLVIQPVISVLPGIEFEVRTSSKNPFYKAKIGHWCESCSPF